jgi:3-oxoacyl-[acyl-carrier protein] reductase
MRELQQLASAAGRAERLLPLSTDISRAAACERAVSAALERFGAIDALINNAGADFASSEGARFYERSVAEWQAVVDVNFTAPFVLGRLVVPAMVARGWGRVVNTLSSPATMARAGFTPYGPTKAALAAATAAWSAELGGTGVTVNAILPGGAVDTRRVSAAERTRYGALLPPEVMGPPIVWLLSSGADTCSGMWIIARAWNPGCSDEENRRTAVQPAW